MARRVLLIAIDAAEKSLVDRWMRSGDLPTLRRLRDRGAYGPLGSLAQVLNFTTWPSFVTGRLAGDHGLNHYLQWQPEQMDFRRPGPDWSGVGVFWHPLAERGRRVITFDIPYAFLADPPPDAVEIHHWGAQYKYTGPYSHPPELMGTIQRRFGKEAFGAAPAGLLRTRQMLALRAELLDAVEKHRRAACYLLENQPWDLFMFAFGSAHRGGHAFWDESALLDTPGPAGREVLANALLDIYRACDAAIDDMLAAAGAETTVLVTALHGMGTNNSLAPLLPEMVRRVLGEAPAETAAAGGLLRRLREAVPEEWRSSAKARLPAGLQDWLGAYWRGQKAYDWAATAAFSPPSDLQGYVRVNLQGREARGIVAPGAEYERLCRLIGDGLQTFVDADTGRPIIKAIHRPGDLFPPGERLHLLPDLIVAWQDIPAKSMRAATSPRFGTVDWPTPGLNPDGYAGHHVTGGWLLAAGPGIRPGATIQDAHQLDLPRTLFALLDEPAPDYLTGRTLSLPGLPLTAAQDGGASN